MKKHSVSLHGHATSISLEPEFWEQLCQIAKMRSQPIASLIQEIDDRRDHSVESGLSGSLRLFVLKTLQNKLAQIDPSVISEDA